jgi:hypothetical protein
MAARKFGPKTSRPVTGQVPVVDAAVSSGKPRSGNMELAFPGGVELWRAQHRIGVVADESLARPIISRGPNWIGSTECDRQGNAWTRWARGESTD